MGNIGVSEESDDLASCQSFFNGVKSDFSHRILHHALSGTSPSSDSSVGSGFPSFTPGAGFDCDCFSCTAMLY